MMMISDNDDEKNIKNNDYNTHTHKIMTMSKRKIVIISAIMRIVITMRIVTTKTIMIT